jgi:hypothetical protein
MRKVQGYRITGRFTVGCQYCNGSTTLKYARSHGGQCKRCAEPQQSLVASHEEQNARYIDCGPAAWDDK